MNFRQRQAVVQDVTGEHVGESRRHVVVLARIQLVFEAIDVVLERILCRVALLLGAVLARVLQRVDAVLLAATVSQCRNLVTTP